MFVKFVGRRVPFHPGSVIYHPVISMRKYVKINNPMCYHIVDRPLCIRTFPLKWEHTVEHVCFCFENYDTIWVAGKWRAQIWLVLSEAAQICRSQVEKLRFYILFSQYRSCDDTQEIWSFVLFIKKEYMQTYSCKTKDQISWVLSHGLYWENKMF